MQSSPEFAKLNREFLAVLSENEDHRHSPYIPLSLTGDEFPDIRPMEINVAEASDRLKSLSDVVYRLFLHRSVLRERGAAEGLGPSHEFYQLTSMLKVLFSFAQFLMRNEAIGLNDKSLPALGMGRFTIRKGWVIVYAMGITEDGQVFCQFDVPESLMATA